MMKKLVSKLVPLYLITICFMCFSSFITVMAAESKEIPSFYDALSTNMLYPDGGLGTETEPYTISSIDQLQFVYNNPDKCYLLTDNLDFSKITYNFLPIPEFTGIFDGNGKQILNFSLNYNPPLPQLSTPCFFSSISSSGTVKNLTFVNPQIINHGRGSAAVLAGGISGTIQNISIIGGSVSSTFYQEGNFIGAFASNLSGTIINCYSNTDIRGYTAGGFAGTAYNSNISNSYFEGSITGYTVGGIAGWSNSCTINDSFVSASLSSEANKGGIFGLVRLTSGTNFSLQNVYWDTTKCNTISSIGIIENYTGASAPTGMVGIGIPANLSFSSYIAQQLTLTTVDLPSGGTVSGIWATTPFYSNISVSLTGNVTPLYDGTSPVTYTIDVGTNKMILTATTIVTNMGIPPRTIISTFNNFNILLNGNIYNADTASLLVNGISQIPVRLFSNALGYGIEWNDNTSEATVTNQLTGDYFVLTADSNIVYGYDSSNNLTGTYTLSSNACLINGRLYAPPSFFSQCLGCQATTRLHTNDTIYIIVSDRHPFWTESELQDLCDSAYML